MVRIAKEFDVDRPIHILFVSDAIAAKTQSNPRTLIVAERHSKATVIESYVSTGEASYFTNAVTEVLLEDGANLSHFKIQRESPRAFHVGTIETEQKRDSHYQSFSFSTGAALSRTNVYTTLNGEGAGATLNGLYMLDGEQHCDHQTKIEHAQPNCFSRELYKGVLDGASHGVFNGKVYVDPIAQKTDGKQTNNVLLLSERAQVDTKPQLEIFADDVKCTHGATVGRIDQTALFYMKSRGVNKELARRLLTYAFAAEVLETIEVDGGARRSSSARRCSGSRVSRRVGYREPSRIRRVGRARASAALARARPRFPIRSRCRASSRSCDEGSRGDAARLSRQCGDDAEAAGGDRRDLALLRRGEREHPSRRALAERARDRGVRPRSRAGARVPRRRARARDHLHARDDGRDQPRRVELR